MQHKHTHTHPATVQNSIKKLFKAHKKKTEKIEFPEYVGYNSIYSLVIYDR